jgi:hypothetical protein
MAAEWVHRGLNEEVEAIGGHYVLVKEERLVIGGHDVLVVVGHAAFDSTCCGVGGCAYALVPGTVVSYQAGQSPEGLPVSLVEPIRDERLQGEVRRAIAAREVVQQVNFL